MPWRDLFHLSGYFLFGMGLLGILWTQFVRSLGIGDGVAHNDIRYIACSLTAVSELIAGLGLIWLSRLNATDAPPEKPPAS